MAGGTVTPLAVPALSDPNRTPTTYPSVRGLGKDGDSKDGDRSNTLLLNVENEDYKGFLFSLNGSDRWSDGTSSIQLSTEDIDLDEFFEDGV